MPRAPLNQFVERIWLVAGGESPRHERILPSGTVELVINLRDDRVQIDATVHSARGKTLSGVAVSGSLASSVNSDAARTGPAVVSSVMVAALAVTVLGCGPAGPQVTRVQARPVAPTLTIDPGEHPLGTDTIRLRDRAKRDGRLYVPRQAAPQRPLPLIVLLHGGGGRAEDFGSMFPLAEEFGVVMLAIDSRHNTWDGIDSPFGPDVQFIDAALRHTFTRVAIDPGRIALGGLSDGGAYSLSLGLVNGDLFTHLVAVAPGFYAPPAPPTGRPRIFVAHGTRDNVYRVAGSRRNIVPRLKSEGYDVTYYEFDGPHWVTEAAARQALQWLVD